MKLVDKYQEEISRTDALEHFGLRFSGGAAVEGMIDKIGMGRDPADLVEKAELRAHSLVDRLIKTGKVRVEDRRFATNAAMQMILNTY